MGSHALALCVLVGASFLGCILIFQQENSTQGGTAGESGANCCVVNLGLSVGARGFPGSAHKQKWHRWGPAGSALWASGEEDLGEAGPGTHPACTDPEVQMLGQKKSDRKSEAQVTEVVPLVMHGWL